jgi:hypothetical protein
MPLPALGAIGTRLFGVHGPAYIDVPDGVVAGSVIVVFIYRGNVSPYDTITLPPDFTLATNSPTDVAADAGQVVLDVAWKRATATESTDDTYNFTWSDNSAFRVGFAVRIDGCRTTGDPFEADDSGVSLTASTDTPAVSVTTTGDNRLLLWCAATYSSGDWTPPTGFTTQVDDLAYDLLLLATAEQPFAGSSGSLVGVQAEAGWGSWSHSAWVGAFVGAGLDGHYFAPVSPAASATSSTVGNETLVLAPWRVRSAIPLDRLVVDIVTDGEPGCTVRPGIYADDGTSYPGALLVDGGALAADAIDTPLAAISLELAEDDLVWIGGVVQDAPTTEPTVRVVDTASLDAPVASVLLADVAGVSVAGYAQAGVSGALPATFLGGGVTAAVPRVIVRHA